MPYNVDNKPLNSKKSLRGAVGFTEKRMCSVFNKHSLSTLCFYRYEIRIYNSNQLLSEKNEKSFRHGPVFYSFTISLF